MAVLEPRSGSQGSARAALWGALLAAPLLLSACAAAPGLAQSEVQLEYTLRIEDPSQQRVELTALLTHLDGPLVVGLPEAFAFVRLDEPRLTDGPRASDGARLEPLDAFTWRLDPGPARAVQLSWSVPLDHRDLPQVRAAFDDYEFPFLESDHGLFVTGALLIGPTELEPSSIHVRFELPAGWPVHAPWPEPEPGRFAPPSARAARDDLVAVGHWRIWREVIQGLTLTVAFAPGQEALEAPVLERIGPIVAAELELFGCLPQANYLFLFGPSELGGCGGSTKTSSMTLFVSPDLPPEWALERLEHLIAHEYYHTWEWAGGHLPDELRFVNEGFTDYYAHLVPWRLGLQGDAHLLRRLEEELAAYEEAQADCGLSLLEAGGPEFFEGGAAYRATYSGGLALAVLTDLAIRSATPGGSLDELLRDFHGDPRWSEGAQPALEDLLALVERYAGAAFRVRFEELVSQRQPPTLTADFVALGLNVQRRELEHPPELRSNLQGTTLVNLDPAGLAGRLGLRAGDRLLAVNGIPVVDESEVRRAWGNPVGGRLSARLERPGKAEPVEIDVSLPPMVRFEVPEALIEALR